MTTVNDVEQFLLEFKAKKAVWELRIDSREINDETILALDITYSYAEKVIDSLVSADYFEGPITEELNMGRPMWVFGKVVKGREVYIKLSLGDHNKNARCFSFHFPIYPMRYPFKT